MVLPGNLHTQSPVASSGSNRDARSAGYHTLRHAQSPQFRERPPKGRRDRSVWPYITRVAQSRNSRDCAFGTYNLHTKPGSVIRSGNCRSRELQGHLTHFRSISTRALKRVEAVPPEGKATLYLQHPAPPELVGVLPYLIHPPSRLASTAAWVRFRDEMLLPMIGHRPDDPNLPRFLAQVEIVLACRATIPAHDRFWRADR
jgi:hypothetical protein